jgi:hypothetical protein
MNKKYVLIALGALTLSTIGFVFYLKSKQKKHDEILEKSVADMIAKYGPIKP